MRVSRRWAPAVLTALLIYVLSVRPVPDTAPVAGTALLGMSARHVIAYAGLAVTVLYRYRFVRARLPHAVLLAATFGFLVEAQQTFLPYRVFSLRDIGANLLGAGTVTVLGLVPSRHRERLAALP